MEKRGRPSAYTQELADEMCARLCEGETLTDICRDEHMPATRTVSDWKKAHEDFSAAFTRARVIGGHAIASRARATARGLTDERGGESTGDVQRDKLIIETDLKLLARWFPKEYGDRTQVAATDTEGQPAQFAPMMFVPVAPKGDGS